MTCLDEAIIVKRGPAHDGWLLLYVQTIVTAAFSGSRSGDRADGMALRRQRREM